MKAPIRADLIVRALSKRHTRDIFLTEVKTGPTIFARPESLRRIDALVIKPSWTRPEFTGYEVKVSRQDFLGDTKWDAYLPYCHRFYFACPAGVIRRDEVPDPAGLVWVDPETLETSVRKAARFRPVEVSWEMLYYIVISRLEPDRHPFFSSEREMLEAWVADKAERLRLGEEVRSKMLRRLEECEQKAADAEQILQERRQMKAALEQLHDLLRPYGIYWIGLCETGFDAFTLDRIRQVLQTGAPQKARALLREAKERLEQAEALMCGECEEVRA